MLRKSTLLAVALIATTIPAFAQYSVSGGGGPVPSSGTGGGGNYTNMLPTSFNTFPLTTPVPAGASSIRRVTITSFTHTWSGDIQAVLWEPTMTTGYNLVVRLGCTPAAVAGFDADYNGTYTFAPAGDPGITQAWPTVNPTTPLPSGVYPQFYGTTGWISGSNNVFNTDLAAIPVVPGTWKLVIYDGAAADQGTIAGWTMSGDTGPTSTVFCSGDGTGTACPCANNGATGNGCASSVNASGAHLAAGGNASVSNDTFVLTGSGMPNSSALYFQGTLQLAAGAGVVFGDGKRCAGGSVTRLGTKTNVSGTSQYPVGSDPLVHVKGSDVAGNVRDYQVWYRNAAAFCNPETFNLSNGVEVTWNP